MPAAMRGGRRLRALPAAVLAVVGLLAGQAGAEPVPSDHDVARSRARVRADAAKVGQVSAALAQAGGLLDDLDDQAEQAVERYNGARVRLDQARAAYGEAQARSARAGDRLARARDDLAVLAAGAYRGDGVLPSAADVLGGPGGTTGFLERATMMQVLLDRQHALLEQENAARTVADVFARQARQALAAEQEATRSAADALQAANAAVARQQSLTRQIEQRKAELSARLAQARRHAATVEGERAAALQRARAAAAPRTGPNSAALSRALARGSGLGSVAAAAALKWVGTPYSWGGGGPAGPTRGIAQGARTVGFDCSGLVTYAWARAGVRLVHYATTQYNSGPHPSRSELRPGDLVFFAHNPADPSTIHHVGIYIGNGQMVEAPFTGARVRISPAFRPDYAGATRPAG